MAIKPKPVRGQKMLLLFAVALLAGLSLAAPLASAMDGADWDDVPFECCCGATLLPLAGLGLRSRRALKKFVVGLLAALELFSRKTSLT